MMLSKYWTQPCEGCTDGPFHTHHLTAWGRMYFRWFAGRSFLARLADSVRGRK